MAATGQAYLCPEHGLIQRVAIPFGADDPVKLCTVEDCDAVVSGPVDVTVTKLGSKPRTADLWLVEDRCIALEAALKRVMRSQAALLDAWAEGKRYDEDSDLCAELVGSRVAGKDALDLPFPRFSARPGEVSANA